MSFDPMGKEPLFKGVWRDNHVEWQFFSGRSLPDEIPVTAVFGVTIVQGCLAIVRTRTVWGLPGGRLEEGETVEEALVREVLEESGVTLEEWHLFGYRLVKTPTDIMNPVLNKPYPRLGCNPYFLGISSQPAQEPRGKDVIEFKILPLDRLSELDSLKYYFRPILDVGLDFYRDKFLIRGE